MVKGSCTDVWASCCMLALGCPGDYHPLHNPSAAARRNLGPLRLTSTLLQTDLQLPPELWRHRSGAAACTPRTTDSRTAAAPGPGHRSYVRRPAGERGDSDSRVCVQACHPAHHTVPYLDPIRHQVVVRLVVLRQLLQQPRVLGLRGRTAVRSGQAGCRRAQRGEEATRSL